MARLKLSGKDKRSNALAAVSDATKAIEISPEWPKGYFRRGQALKALNQFEEALSAFRKGQQLEPDNGDWAKEIEKCNADQAKSPQECLRQLILTIVPEVLSAWVSGLKACPDGEAQVLVVAQTTATGPDLSALGEPPDPKTGSSSTPKTQLRYAAISRKAFLLNYVAGCADQEAPKDGSPPQLPAGDLLGRKPLALPKVSAFLDSEGAKNACTVALEIPIKSNKSARVFFSLPYDTSWMEPFIPPLPEPNPPKGAVEGVLE